MGVESIELDTVNLRMVARTLPGKQFEVGRRLRVLVIAALSQAGIATPTEQHADGRRHHAPRERPRRRERSGARKDSDSEGRTGSPSATTAAGPRYLLGGRIRTSTAAPDHRVHRAVLGVPELRAAAADAGAGNRSGAAGLRPRPELHLGAADQRAQRATTTTTTTPTTTETTTDHDVTHGATSPERLTDGDLADVTDVADVADRRPRRRPSGAAPISGAAPSRGAESATGAAAPADVDALRLRPVSPLHWRAVMITLDHVSKQYKSSARPALDNVTRQDRQG